MICLLNGARLLQVAPVAWRSTPGIAPSATTVFVDQDALDQALNDTRNAELVIGSRAISNLIILRVASGTGSGDERLSHAITLVDRRWLLSRRIYTAAFNQRRRTGELGIAAGPEPIQVRATVPVEEYISSTLNNGAPWTLREAIEKVLFDVGFSVVSIPANFPDIQAFGARGFVREGSQSDILRGLLDLAPGFEFALRDSGEGYLYDVTSIADEQRELNKVSPALFGGGVAAPADRRYERPSRIEVYFLAEPEIRFSYEEEQDEIFGQSSPVTSIISGVDVAPAYLESWIETPVPGLQLYGKETARGSLANLYAFLDGLSDPIGLSLYPLPGTAVMGAITGDVIKQLYLVPWEADAQYVVDGSFINKNYARIWRQILNSFRVQYRLSRDWVDRVRLVRPFRAELIDAVTLTRRPSPVFSDYTSRPAQRMSTVKTVTGYNSVVWQQEDSVQDSLANCLYAPALISITDQEAKAFRVLYRKSPSGKDDEVIPCVFETPPPVINQVNIAVQLYAGIRIKGSWKMDTILTCLPYQRPGSFSHLHKVNVSPTDAAAAAGVSRARIGPCEGPVMQVLVEESPLTTARFFWSDGASEEMRAPFFDDFATFPDSQLQNKLTVEALAKATAASIYMSTLDTIEGRQTTTATGIAPELAGGMTGVETKATPFEQITTSVSFAPRSQPLNPFRFLPPDVRRQLTQTIIPGGNP